MEFINAINMEDESTEPFSDNSSVAINHGAPKDVAEDLLSVAFEDSIVKGLLGKGKSRTMFNLTVNMASAQILLMNENEAKLATLCQDNLLTDIKVCWCLYPFDQVSGLSFLFLLISGDAYLFCLLIIVLLCPLLRCSLPHFA